jgi:long-chain acyl-CoA synthetase
VLPVWAEQHGKPADVTRLVDDPDLRAEIQAAVDDANKAVSRAESIRKFTVLPVDWTEEGGQLTPSLKLRRSVVMRECRADVEALYDT